MSAGIKIKKSHLSLVLKQTSETKHIYAHESKTSKQKYSITDIQQGATKRAENKKEMVITLAGCAEGAET